MAMASSAVTVTLFLMLSMTLLAMGSSSRILIMTMPGKSHQSLFTGIAEELIRRNHDVYVFFGCHYSVLNRLERLSVKWLKFRSDLDAGNKLQNIEKELIRFTMETETSARSFTAKMADLVTTGCHALVSDEAILLEMERLSFDLVLVDNSIVFKCAFLVIHRLGVPHVSLMNHLEPWALRLPWLPSFAPFKMLPYTEKMSFLERLLNALAQTGWLLFPAVPQVPPDIRERYQRYGHFGSVDELRAQSLLYFVTSDYHLDYPLPFMPFMIQIPGLTIVPSKELPPALGRMIADSLDGAVLVSFGSTAVDLPRLIAEKMLGAFERLNQTVFWRYTNTYNLSMPSNVHIMDWLPQIDLLAHAKVKAFVTHAGNSGQHEALYYGVPMVAFPLFGDQSYNAKRMEYKGFGVTLNIKAFTSDELLSKILLIIEDPSYKAAIRKASKMFRSRPYVSWERAAFWIEHVINYGADHLHSYSQTMPWYQFLMLDIALFCLLSLGVVIVVVKKLTDLCRRRGIVDRKEKSLLNFKLKKKKNVQMTT